MGVLADVWAKLRHCESGGRYDVNTGNGFFGAYQFTAATWRGLGFPGLPHQAAPEVQDEAARRLQARRHVPVAPAPVAPSPAPPAAPSA